MNESPILKTTKIILHRGADKKENINNRTQSGLRVMHEWNGLPIYKSINPT